MSRSFALSSMSLRPTSASPIPLRSPKAQLLEDGFGPERYYECLIAELDARTGRICPLLPRLLHLAGPQSVSRRPFVRPEFRGHGIGKALLTRVAAIAVERNCARLDWNVLAWNQPAIDFYRGLDARLLDDWHRMRVSGEALAALAAETEAEAKA